LLHVLQRREVGSGTKGIASAREYYSLAGTGLRQVYENGRELLNQRSIKGIPLVGTVQRHRSQASLKLKLNVIHGVLRQDWLTH
jgi:hypothetical protein